MEVNHNQLEKLAKKSLNTGLSMYVSGAAGIGKSYAIAKVAKEYAIKLEKEFVDWNRADTQLKIDLANPENQTLREGKYIFVDSRIAQQDPTDLKGLPKLEDEYVRWLPPLYIKVMSFKESSGLLFFDELNLAPPSVQGACYQIVLDKCIGEVSLSDNISVFAAGNRMIDKAAVYDRPAPLKNRFRNVELRSPSATEWIENFALKNGIDDRIIMFLKYRPEHIFEDYTKKELGDNFATHRSWENLSKDIKDEDSIDDIRMYASSIIGAGIAIELAAFVKMKDEISVEDILNNPDKFRNLEASQKFSITGSIASMYGVQSEQGNSLKFINRIVPLIKEKRMQADLFCLLAKMCISKNKLFVNQIASIPEAAKLLSSGYIKYLN